MPRKTKTRSLNKQRPSFKKRKLTKAQRRARNKKDRERKKRRRAKIQEEVFKTSFKPRPIANVGPKIQVSFG